MHLCLVQLHPDVNAKDPKTHEKFVKVNEAYSILSKPISRKEYDVSLSYRVQMEKQARQSSRSHMGGSNPWPGHGFDAQ